MNLQFIETPIYTEQIGQLLSEEEQRLIQWHLLEQPSRGALIKGSGGLRKLRWSGSGRGKRGGIRVIYYLWHEHTAYLLFAYPKNKQEDLGAEQLKVLKQLIELYTQ